MKRLIPDTQTSEAVRVVIAEVGWRMGDLIAGAADFGLIQAERHDQPAGTGFREYQLFFIRIQEGIADLAARLEVVRQLYCQSPVDEAGSSADERELP